MRGSPLACLAAGLLVGCGTVGGLPDSSVDAGLDSGVMTVVDAGRPPVCLADVFDAGATDAGTDGGYDFSCRGQAFAAGGQPEFFVEGRTMRGGFQPSPMPGVHLELITRSGVVLASGTTSDAGRYEMRFDAGCQPVDALVRATAPESDAGFLPSYAVPAAPWQYDRPDLDLTMFDAETRGLVAAIADVVISPATSALAVSVVDCRGAKVQHAKVLISGAGVVRYLNSSGLPNKQLTETGVNGDALLFNLPGTAAELSVTLDGVEVARRSVPIFPDTLSGTTLAPQAP